MNDDSATILMGPDSGLPEDDSGPHLVILEGARPGGRLRLDQSILTLGRKPDNDLVLESTAVSKHHARISSNEDGFYIEDLGSLNGVVVNGRRLDPGVPIRLFHGDVLRLSDHLLIFRNPAPLTDAQGLSTIAIDLAEVRAEANRLLEDLL